MSFGPTHFRWAESIFSGAGWAFRTTHNFTGDFQNGVGYQPVANLKGRDHRRYYGLVSEDRENKGRNPRR